jgi:hypothetical protein
MFVKTIDGGDVGVVQRGQQLGLAVEARQPLGLARHVGRKHLDRDLAVEGGVLGLPDHAHPALADLLDQAVVQQLLSGFDGHVCGPLPGRETAPS